jgi:hypothetical protein
MILRGRGLCNNHDSKPDIWIFGTFPTESAASATAIPEAGSVESETDQALTDPTHRVARNTGKRTPPTSVPTDAAPELANASTASAVMARHVVFQLPIILGYFFPAARSVQPISSKRPDLLHLEPWPEMKSALGSRRGSGNPISAVYLRPRLRALRKASMASSASS